LIDKTQDHAELSLPSELPSIDRVEEVAFAFAERAGFDDATASNIGMVAREAAVNAILHGNQFDRSKNIHAAFELSAESLTIRISDQGPGLDLDAVPDPLQPENLMRTSGRGIFLMKAFMDEVHLRQLDPGTEIALIKRRP
jgi:serine/threonine-protein kinase RsbW